MQKKCKHEGCTTIARQSGFCRRHFIAWWRSGQPQEPMCSNIGAEIAELAQLTGIPVSKLSLLTGIPFRALYMQTYNPQQLIKPKYHKIILDMLHEYRVKEYERLKNILEKH